MPAEVTIRTRTNADWSFGFIYEVENPNGTVARRSLMHKTLKLNVRASAEAAQALALTSATPDGGIEMTEAVNGEFQVTFKAAQLAGLGPGVYVHDLIAAGADGSIETVWEGTLENELGVTRT